VKVASESRQEPAGDDQAALAAANRLHSAAIHLLRRLRTQDEASGLSAPRLSALSVIVFAGPLTLSALAAAEQVRPPTMTRIVAALEGAGLIVREPGLDDRREIYVRATPAGERVLHEGRLRRVEVLAHYLAVLSDADRAALDRAAAILEGFARAPQV
jgi:DNA-binding MarR family transcriptional regulator